MTRKQHQHAILTNRFIRTSLGEIYLFMKFENQNYITAYDGRRSILIAPNTYSWVMKETIPADRFLSLISFAG